MSQPVPIPGRTNQYTQEVEEYQHFNGATCLVIVDLTNFGNALALKEVMAGRPGPTDDELGDAIEKEIRRQITKCPSGSDVKVQLMYHATAKTLPEKRGKNRMWKMQNPIKKTLKNLQAIVSVSYLNLSTLRQTERPDNRLNLPRSYVFILGG